jgi:hypothetical protein
MGDTARESGGGKAPGPPGGDVPQDTNVSPNEAHHEQDAGGDDVAGSEFLDDRLRLRE